MPDQNTGPGCRFRRLGLARQAAAGQLPNGGSRAVDGPRPPTLCRAPVVNAELVALRIGHDNPGGEIAFLLFTQALAAKTLYLDREIGSIGNLDVEMETVLDQLRFRDELKGEVRALVAEPPQIHEVARSLENLDAEDCRPETGCLIEVGRVVHDRRDVYFFAHGSIICRHVLPVRRKLPDPQGSGTDPCPHRAL